MTVTTAFVGRRSTRPAQTAAAAAAGLAGVLVGIAVSADPPVGIALGLAALAVPLALVDLPLAAAAWIALGPLSGLAPFGLATTACGVLVLAAWLVHVPAERERMAAALRPHRALLVAIGLLLVWLALSAAWAEDPGTAVRELVRWCTGALALVVLLTSVRTRRDVMLVVVAIVAGTLASVLIGLAAGGLGEAAAGVDTATTTEGRLQGGADDPNFLAALIVPAVVLAAALAGLVRAWARTGLFVAIVVLVVGLGATQSRGGALAAGAALAAALIVMRGRRGRVLGVAALVACIAVAYGAASPGALERLTSAEDRGNGREDLWLVAGRMLSDHPVAGVGLDNFRVRAAEYVREPGSLQFVDLIADRPHQAHNTYLQLLAETGVVGFALFAAVVLLALASAGAAARRLDVAGDPALAHLARAVLVASVGVLTAAVFLSAGARPMLWNLLALGPVLLGLAPPDRARFRG